MEPIFHQKSIKKISKDKDWKNTYNNEHEINKITVQREI